jgi:hypothetical protein
MKQFCKWCVIVNIMSECYRNVGWKTWKSELFLHVFAFMSQDFFCESVYFLTE